MDIDVKFDCAEVNWKEVADTLKQVQMGHHEPCLHKKAFENSYVTVFLYHKGRMIGFGRAISDGAYQAAVYDVAVNPDYQKMGLGNLIVGNIIDRLPMPVCNIILYASPGKEGFYLKHGFRKMKTGMARFSNAEKMAEKGFTE